MIMRGRTRFPVRVGTPSTGGRVGLWIETPDGTLWAPGDWEVAEQRAQLVRARDTADAARDPPVGQLDGHRRLTAAFSSG